MRSVWGRVEPFVATKRAAAALVLIALLVYWIEVIAWPFERGRDSWDYMTYYLSFFDAHTPFTEVMLFRTPVTPFALGIPLSLGGVTALEVTMAALYALAVLAWSLAALAYSRLAAVLVAVVLLAYTVFALPFHEASSDGIASFAFSLFALGVVKTGFRPSAARFAALGVGAAAVTLTRPAYIVLLAGFLIPLCLRSPWRGRIVWGAAYLAAALVVLGAWAVFNDLRYGDLTISRLSAAGRMPRVVPDAGPASKRLTALVRRDVLSLPPYRSLHVDPATYYDGLSNHEWVRLLGIADQTDGLRSGYALLHRADAESGRVHRAPRAPQAGEEKLSRPVFLARSVWRYLSRPAYRDQTHLKPGVWPTPPPTVSFDGKLLPNPEALPPSLQAISFGFLPCASNEIARCILADPSVAYSDPRQVRRYAEITRTVRSWDSGLGTGKPNRWLSIQLDRVAHYFPQPWLWLLLGACAFPFRRPRGGGVLVALLGLGGLVLLLHAFVVGWVQPYAFPVLPAALMAGICAATGARSRTGDKTE